jgi:hypothetical protein
MPRCCRTACLRTSGATTRSCSSGRSCRDAAPHVLR